MGVVSEVADEGAGMVALEFRSASSVFLTHVFKISRHILCQNKKLKSTNGTRGTDRGTDLAYFSSPGGIFRSKHLMMWLLFSPELRAITPARSSALFVRSRCRSDVDSGRNSASAIAPAELRCVEERKRRLRELLSVNAVLRDWIYCPDEYQKETT